MPNISQVPRFNIMNENNNKGLKSCLLYHSDSCGVSWLFFSLLQPDYWFKHHLVVNTADKFWFSLLRLICEFS